jgi:hypothetical protein
MSVMPSTPQPAAVVSEALLVARQITGMSHGDFGLSVGIILGRVPTASYVAEAEAGGICPPADYLVAAGIVSTTSVSVLLGEWNYEEERLDQLEAEMAELRRTG